MCNAYYIIITVELRQAFFGDFLFSQKVLDIVLFCIFPLIIHILLATLIYFYHFIQDSLKHFIGIQSITFSI